MFFSFAFLTALLSAAATPPSSPPAGKGEAARRPTGQIVLAHILVSYKGCKGAPKTVKRTKEEARKLAERLAAELKKKPALWSDYVTRYSDDWRSKRQEGKIGVFFWDRLPVFVRSFGPELAKLAPGRTSRAVETDYGFHVFRYFRSESYGALEIVITYKGSMIPAYRLSRNVTRTRAEAAQLARKVAKEARKPGADFDSLAEKYSDMWDLKGYARGFTVYKDFCVLPQVVEALSKVPPGGIAGPVESKFGFHVFKRITPAIEAGWILIRFKAGSRDKEVKRTPEEAKRLAEELHRRIVTGEKTFEEIAEKYSEHKESASRGGYLGLKPLGYFYPPVERAAFSLKPGEISSVLRDQVSYVVVKRY